MAGGLNIGGTLSADVEVWITADSGVFINPEHPDRGFQRALLSDPAVGFIVPRTVVSEVVDKPAYLETRLTQAMRLASLSEDGRLCFADDVRQVEYASSVSSFNPRVFSHCFGVEDAAVVRFSRDYQLPLAAYNPKLTSQLSGGPLERQAHFGSSQFVFAGSGLGTVSVADALYATVSSDPGAVGAATLPEADLWTHLGDGNAEVARAFSADLYGSITGKIEEEKAKHP